MDKLITCKTCGKEIAKSAKTCPECGAKNKKSIIKKWWFWAIIVIAVICIAISSSNSNNTTPTNESTETTTETQVTKEKKNSPKINMDEFEALQTGMTYEEAVAIVGGEGEIMSQVDVAGYNTVVYTWVGEGTIGANANATFQNDSLVSKAQAGLK